MIRQRARNSPSRRWTITSFDVPSFSRREFVGKCATLAGASCVPLSLPLLTPFEEARFKLRKDQADAAKGAPGFPYADLPDTTQQALEQLHIQRRVVPTDDPDRVRRGEFSFHRDLEQERMQRAEDLIRRIEPGPFENPGYFAYLAYEVASFELAFSTLRDQFSRVLFGTVHDANAESSSRHTTAGACTVVFMNSGLIDFFYQAAKASIEAQRPVRSRNFVQTDADLKDVRDRLKINPAPVERLYHTLESYFYLGYPRAFPNEPLLPEQSVVMDALKGMTERWAIAHEYGHRLALGLNFEKSPGSAAWSEEYFADVNATVLTVLSAARLDRLPPEVSLGGGNFALACLEIVRRAYSIVTTGLQGEDVGTETHPPSRERAQQNIAIFRRFFNVKYDTTDHGFDLSLVVPGKTTNGDSFGSDRVAQAYAPANVLLAIWPAVKERLLQQYKSKRPLHKIWH